MCCYQFVMGAASVTLVAPRSPSAVHRSPLKPGTRMFPWRTSSRNTPAIGRMRPSLIASAIQTNRSALEAHELYPAGSPDRNIRRHPRAPQAWDGDWNTRLATQMPLLPAGCWAGFRNSKRKHTDPPFDNAYATLHAARCRGIAHNGRQGRLAPKSS